MTSPVLDAIQALKPGDSVAVDGLPYTVATNAQDVIELFPVGYEDTTGSYRRASYANLESLVNLGRATLPGAKLARSTTAPRTDEGPSI